MFDKHDIEYIRNLKTRIIKAQDYETGARLRDLEKVIEGKVENEEKRKLAELNGKDNFTKEQVKSLLDNAVKAHEEKILVLEKINIKYEKEIQNLRETVVETVDLTNQFGEYLLKFAETYHGLFKGVPMVVWRRRDDQHPWDGEPASVYNTDQMYAQFLDWRYDPKNKADDNLDPDNGEKLWVKTQ